MTMADDAQQEGVSRLHTVVHGRVQGVHFRAFTAQQAISLNLTGWVRNLPDGSVEAVFEGSHSDLERMLDILRSGPPSAHVTTIDRDWGQASGEFSAFRVRLF